MISSSERPARPLSRFARRFARRWLALAGAATTIVVVLVAVFAPVIAPYEPGAIDFSSILRAPGTTGHILGTDDLGRDVLSRVIWGARASMQAGVFSTLLAVAIAVPIGLVAGYYRGWLDSAIGRATDTLLAFPYLIVAVGLAVILGASLTNATIAIGLVQIPKLVRVTRGEVLSVREEAFVAGAVADGASDRFILFRHILPNVTNTLIVQATILIPYAIIAESSLSFLGLGVQPPTPSWGVMLTAAQPYLDRSPWLALVPGLAVSLTTLSFNVFGDGLRDAIDPRGAR